MTTRKNFQKAAMERLYWQPGLCSGFVPTFSLQPQSKCGAQVALILNPLSKVALSLHRSKKKPSRIMFHALVLLELQRNNLGFNHELLKLAAN